MERLPELRQGAAVVFADGPFFPAAALPVVAATAVAPFAVADGVGGGTGGGGVVAAVLSGGGDDASGGGVVGVPGTAGTTAVADESDAAATSAAGAAAPSDGGGAGGEVSGGVPGTAVTVVGSPLRDFQIANPPRAIATNSTAPTIAIMVVLFPERAFPIGPAGGFDATWGVAGGTVATGGVAAVTAGASTLGAGAVGTPPDDRAARYPAPDIDGTAPLPSITPRPESRSRRSRCKSDFMSAAV